MGANVKGLSTMEALDTMKDKKSYGFAEDYGAEEAGNIDINNRKVKNNSDGSISTENSITIGAQVDGKEKYFVIPTIIDGKQVSEKEAEEHFFKTHEHLGMFGDSDKANRYAEDLHKRQEDYYNRRNTENLDLAIKNGDAKAATEVLTEKISDGVAIFGGNDLKKWAVKKFPVLEKMVKNRLVSAGIDIAGENFEETLSDILGVTIDRATVEPDKQYSLEDFTDTQIATVLSTVAMNILTKGAYSGVNNVKSTVNNIRGKNNTENIIAERKNEVENNRQALLESVNEKNQENAEKQQATMQNNEVLQEGQQTTQEETKSSENATSQELEENAKNQPEYKRIEEEKRNREKELHKASMDNYKEMIEKGYARDEIRDGNTYTLPTEKGKNTVEGRELWQKHVDIQNEFRQMDNEIVQSMKLRNEILDKINKYDDFKAGSEDSSYIASIASSEGVTENDIRQAIEERYGDTSIETQNQIFNDVNETLLNNNVDINQEMDYNNLNEEEINNEFRRIQEESRRESYDSIKEQGKSTSNNEGLRERLSGIFGRELERRGYNSSSNKSLSLKSDKGTTFDMYEDVDAETFHDIFEVAKKYTDNGELVDLHEIKSNVDEGEIGYEDTKNYISKDGLSGFAITKDGDLISVFNASNKKGFLSSIADVIKKNVKTLDCYVSPNQNLQEMYQKKFGFKTAAIMDYNMKYDHDNIAANHNKPQVAFMVNTDQNIETKHFNENQYDEALQYRNSFLNNENSQNEGSFISAENAENTLPEQPKLLKAEEVEKQNNAQTETDEDLEKIREANILNEKEETEQKETKPYSHLIKGMESDFVDEKAKEKIKKIIPTPNGRYEVIHNEEKIIESEEKIEKRGLDNVYQEYCDDFDDGKEMSLEDIYDCEVMIQQYSYLGDTEKVMQLLARQAVLGKTLGQRIQAMSIISRGTKEGKLLYMQKSLQRYNNEYNQNIKIDEKLAKELLESKTDNQIEKAVDKIYQDIGKQMPPSMWDSIDAWRHFSMLFNPSTHIRNLGGNVGMHVMQGLKNEFNGLMQDIYKKFKPEFQQTVSAFRRPSKEMKEFAHEDIGHIGDIDEYGSKYADTFRVEAEKYKRRLLPRI